jgi:hypothetical protein
MQIRAVDAAGNIDGSPANYPWTVQAGGAPVNCGAAQTLPATADAWIEESSPTSNKGDDSILKVMSKSGNSNLRALVTFALPSQPAGCVVDTATLRLYAASSVGGRTIQALRVNGTWTESGVTWANQPQTTGTAATVTSASGYMQWNVATLVQAMYSTGSNNGFLIRDATEGQDAEQQLHAREKGENMPQLVITFKPAGAASAPGGPGAPVSCIGSCGSTAEAWAFAPVTVETAGLLGTVMALSLGAAAFAALVGRRAISAPPVAGAYLGWRQAIPR